METPTLVSGATPTWVTYATVWAVTVALVFFLRRLRRHKLNSPPGPRPWPIIGNLNLIGSLPHHSLHELSQKYGPLMQLKFGSFPVIVGSSVEVAKAILKTHDVTFSGRPKTAAGKYTTYNYSDITWSPYGPYWRQARKMCLMELFSAKRLESYEYIRVEELRNLLKAIYNASGKPINLKDNLTDVSLNVISRMVFGKKYTIRNENEKEIVTPEEFKEMLDELFLLNGVLEIGDSIPWVSFLDLQGYIKRMKGVAKKFDRFMEHVLDEHNARRKSDQNWSPKDMVDLLLELADDPNLDVKIERHGVKAFSQDMIAGGTESSAVTEELDRVIGKERWVEEKDMVNLPYIYAIAKEVMRLHPVAPMLVPREARDDVKINGYDIKKGTRVLVGLLDEEKLLPLGKCITTVGIFSSKNGIPEIKSCEDLPYFLSDLTKDQMVADLAFKAKILLWSGLVLGSLSIGILGYAVTRNWNRWKEWRQRRLSQQSSQNSSDEAVTDGQLCVICLMRRRQSTFIPCGHLVCCGLCAISVQRDVSPNCPLCRQAVRGYLTVDRQSSM